MEPTTCHDYCTGIVQHEGVKTTKGVMVTKTAVRAAEGTACALKAQENCYSDFLMIEGSSCMLPWHHCRPTILLHSI